MNILHISPVPIWDVKEKSGMPSTYWGLKGFADRGHAVVYMFSGGQNRRTRYEGFMIHEFRLWTLPIPPRFVWLHRFSNKVTAVCFFFAATVRGLALSRSFKPDVIYGHYHAAPVAWVIGRIRRVPNITRMFGTFLFPCVNSFWGRMRKPEEIIAFKTPCAYMIITNDGTRGDDCARVLGVPSERVKYWVNGVDRGFRLGDADANRIKRSLNIPSDHRILLAVSRLVSWKRVDRLLTALPEVLERYPKVTAVIVGDGDDRVHLERMAAALGVEDHVRFTGAVPHGEIPLFMAAADVFATLYDFSNVGNPLLEALRCGKCIVAADTGGTARIIQDGKTGMLLNQTDMGRLPALLVELLEDDAKRRSLGEAARQYADENIRTWPERMEMEIGLIEDLVGTTEDRK